jgi:hypothetical protein
LGGLSQSIPRVSLPWSALASLATATKVKDAQ